MNPLLIEAILAGSPGVTAVLLASELGGTAEARDVEFGATALHWAAAGGDEENARALLLQGADVNVSKIPL